MRKRFWIALGFSLALHAGVVATTRDDVFLPGSRPPSWWPAQVDFTSADEVVVLAEEEIAPETEDDKPIEELESVVEDPVAYDGDVDDACALGDPRFSGAIGLGSTSSALDGPGCNGSIGIGGGAGGAFGGRRGGRRNLKAGGGGRAAPVGGPVVWPDEHLRLVASVDGAEVGEFPLQRTKADAEVAAWVATTRLTQTFSNPFDAAVEAVYVFPLPSNAAVNAFEMVVQGRHIVGIVRPREEAERIYDEARRAGKTASLLTQERPNVFTQSVANIAPHESVDIQVTFFHGLTYDHGAYEYVLPTVVAPRYATAKTASAGTSAEPGERALAAMPLPPTGASLGGVSLSLAIDAGVPIRDVTSPSHALRTALSGNRATVELEDGAVDADRDIVVRWTVAGDDLGVGVLAHADRERGGFFSLFVVPMLDPSGADVGAREVTFVIDTSGSMNGVPIETSKALVEASLHRMRPYDRFNVLRFAGSAGGFAEGPVDASPENVAAGIDYVRKLESGGGTEMMKALTAWIAQPGDPRYLRTVVFLTDGQVSEETAIREVIRADGRAARWFAFGVGDSVNRFLIESIAEEGHGAYEVVPADPTLAAAAADRLVERFDAPLLLDAHLGLNGLPLSDVTPGRVPDLFAGRPLVVTGRYTGAVCGTVFVRGSVGGRAIAIPVDIDLPADEPRNVGIASIWARQRIEAVEDELVAAHDAERAPLLAEIEALGLAHSLVTRRTSFVAVDEGRVVSDGFPLRLVAAADVPDGVRYWGDVGAPPDTRGVEVGAWGLLVADAKRGELMIARVDRRSPAAHAGLHRGFVVERVDDHLVRDARHFLDLLAARADGDVRIGYRNGAGAELRTTTLRR